MTAGFAGGLPAPCSPRSPNWTFYYLLALTVAARELTRDRLVAATASRRVPLKRETAGTRPVLGGLAPSASAQ